MRPGTPPLRSVLAAIAVDSWLAFVAVLGLVVPLDALAGMAGQDGSPSDTRFNVGLVVDLNDVHHLLFSAGHSFTSASAQAYIAYQITVGPSETSATGR